MNRNKIITIAAAADPCVASRLANGTWQQDGISKAVAIADAKTYCSYGPAFNGVSSAETGIGPNTSGQQ
jgi:hypothetical protein